MDYRTIPLNPDPASVTGTALYRVAHPVFGFLMRRYIPTAVTGVGHIPRTGGVIVASNHLSMLDVPLLGHAIGRTARFPSKPEIFGFRPLAAFLLALGGFPITRGEGDRRALSFSEEVLARGGVLSIFPEGTRSLDGEVHDFHRGVALLAMTAGVPVVPAALWGSQVSFPKGAIFPRPARISIVFGAPEPVVAFAADPVRRKKDSIDLTRRLEDRVRELVRVARSG